MKYMCNRIFLMPLSRSTPSIMGLMIVMIHRDQCGNSRVCIWSENIQLPYTSKLEVVWLACVQPPTSLQIRPLGLLKQVMWEDIGICSLFQTAHIRHKCTGDLARAWLNTCGNHNGTGRIDGTDRTLLIFVTGWFMIVNKLQLPKTSKSEVIWYRTFPKRWPDHSMYEYSPRNYFDPQLYLNLCLFRKSH